MTTGRWFAALVGAVLLVQGAQTTNGADAKKGARFASLESQTPEAVQAKALAWFKDAVKGDAARLARFQAIWKQDDRTIVDRLADTFVLGSADAARLMAEARNPLTPAPTKVPALLRDAKQPEFFRANLAFIYARALSNRRVHEEALDALKQFGPEQVIDPAGYLFHRAVCEHAMLLKQDASKTVGQLLTQAIDSPERYKTVGALMLLDMQAWKEKDLGAVARKMGNVERRLELARGGPQTQKLQKEIVSRLDELIKELENKAKNKQQQQSQGQGEPNGGSCPNGGQGQQQGNQGGAKPTSPMQDSQLATNGGSGRVDQAKLRKLAEGWGRMNERDRAAAMAELADLTRGLSLAHQEAYREYFRRMADEAARRAQAPR
jgi:hypothetical protein